MSLGLRTAGRVTMVVGLGMVMAAGGPLACAHRTTMADGLLPASIPVQLPSGSAVVDLYWPDAIAPAPLVIIAHGFMRGRQQMAGWGRHLAQSGMVAAVPDLPSWSDHARNGRFLTELRIRLLGEERWRERIDPQRLGLMGFSAGGLSSLLSALDDPAPLIWIGLDPVDRDGLGAAAVARLQADVVILTADPSAWNAHGNARDLIAAAQPHGRHVPVPGAVHVDAEWPTTWLAQQVCGCSTAEKQAQFRERATESLRRAFTP